jgi:Spy/CpxP family protein refolding chaperone
MFNRIRFLTLMLLAAGAVAVLSQPASAQRGGGRRGGFGRMFRGGYHQVALATLPEVQENLKLTDEQKTSVDELNEAFNDARREARGDGDGGGGGGGRGGFGQLTDEQREALNKVNAEYLAKLNEGLEEAQRTRLQEIYVQANGTSLFAGFAPDEAVVAELKITDEQKEKLAEVSDDNRQVMRDSAGDLQDLSDEERDAEVADIIKEADDALLAVLTDEQREAFTKMQGEKIELDLSQLRGRFGRGGGRRGGGI